MTLKEALIKKGYSAGKANQLISNMRENVKEGSDPYFELSKLGLPAKYADDLMPVL